MGEDGDGAESDYDPRLVALYDGDNPPGPDHDFYRHLVNETGARSVLDLGCGTGLLTVTFCLPGRRVVGVDPSRTMLSFALARPGSERVTWLPGDSRDIPDTFFDLAVMTGNVAQHILGAEWPRTLRDLHRCLRPGGTLAFDSRNPDLRVWERWATAPAATRDTVHGPLREWIEATEVEPGVVDLTFHNVFECTGEHVIERSALAFRGCEEITAQLAEAGFAVDATWGDWERTPFSPDGPIMVFEARSASSG